ncbi:Ohr family peroxiredoxin [Microbispora sp. NBC_01189]|uniref:Ohr family peroxiredoxin n=1 Tax=Microbispora sp. NBC_01189 TaxID=2903583 RepID=UPI002E155A93|nr:Ohr family peroxiredoxin [Microbispora sp. NBC_01189]
MSEEVWRATHLPGDRAPGPDYSGPGVEAEITGLMCPDEGRTEDRTEDRTGERPGKAAQPVPAREGGPGQERRGGDGSYDGLYTARASSTLGKVASDDGLLDVRIKAPPELGGPGGETNPEQLLAAAYASCFHNSLTLVAGRQGARTADATVDASVTLRKRGVADDYTISTDLTVRLPGIEPETARRLVDEAHRECPYSRAFTQGAEVHVRVA